MMNDIQAEYNAYVAEYSADAQKKSADYCAGLKQYSCEIDEAAQKIAASEGISYRDALLRHIHQRAAFIKTIEPLKKYHEKTTLKKY